MRDSRPGFGERNNDGIIDAGAGEFASLTIWSLCPGGGVGFASSFYDIAGDANWQSNGVLTSYDNVFDDLTNDGTPGSGNSVTAIQWFQLPPLFNPSFDASNPAVICQLQWHPTVTGVYPVTASSAHSTHDWYSDDFGTTFSCAPPYSPSITFQVIPSPEVSIVGLMGFVARRQAAVKPQRARVPALEWAAKVLPCTCLGTPPPRSARRRSIPSGMTLVDRDPLVS